MFRFGVGGCIADSLDTHVGQWGVKVIEAGVRPIILLEISPREYMDEGIP